MIRSSNELYTQYNEKKRQRRKIPFQQQVPTGERRSYLCLKEAPGHGPSKEEKRGLIDQEAAEACYTYKEHQQLLVAIVSPYALDRSHTRYRAVSIVASIQ